ncbi:hypothetical protein KAR91_81100 [Candidatus Pacearchaeota archaeon]|nr:hypothetical protein [Candidatus Pacearchaeota archaeon]
MKKLLIILLLLAAPVYAAKYRGTSEALRVPGTQVLQIFDNFSTIGVGVSIPSDFLADQGSWQIVVNGSPTAYELAVEGSLISASGPYEPISSIDETSVKLRHWDAKPVPFTQIIINSMTGDGSFDLYLIKRGN